MFIGLFLEVKCAPGSFKEVDSFNRKCCSGISYRRNGSHVPPTSKLWWETSKLRLQKIQILTETFILEFGLFFKFGVIAWFTK